VNVNFERNLAVSLAFIDARADNLKPDKSVKTPQKMHVALERFCKGERQNPCSEL
jgi:hypothetical protein